MNPTPETNPSNKPPAKKVDIIFLLLFLAALGITLFCSFGEHWPTTQIIEIQARMMDGSYYPKLTFLLTLMVFLLPLLFVKWLMDKMKKKKDAQG